MENVAQGRVWSGRDAASRGLVDSIGGFSRAVAIAKLKANIPQDRKVLSHFSDLDNITKHTTINGCELLHIGFKRFFLLFCVIFVLFFLFLFC